MRTATAISRMLSVLIALFLTAGCVRVTGAGKWSGTYSFECIPRAKLKSQVREYDEQIQPLLSQSAEVQRRIKQDEFFLRYTIARKGNTGGCGTPKAGDWPKRPPFFACSPGDAAKPFWICGMGSRINDASLFSSGGCLAAVRALSAQGRPNGVSEAALAEICEAYLVSEGVKSAADLQEKFLEDVGLGLLEEAARQSNETPLALGIGLVKLWQTGQCVTRAANYCTNRYTLYEFERKLAGRPEALRQACEEREASLANNRQSLTGLEREVEALRRESAPVRQAFAEKDRSLDSQGIDCGG